MTDSETLSWVELLVLMVDGPHPEPSVRGAIRSDPDPSDESFGWTVSMGEPLPVHAGARPQPADPTSVPPIKVWRDGGKIRIEEPGGTPNLIVGETACWRFDADHEAPVESPATAVHYTGSGTELLTRREASEFLGHDFTRPTGPVAATTFLGRQSWAVELAPPPHKPHPMQLVVDAQTGLVLQQRTDDFGTVSEWVEFVVGESLDPALFTWEGAVRSATEEQAEWKASYQRDQAQRRRWFIENVAALPVSVELEVEIGVHQYDEETGAFEGSFGHGFGSVARRPHSDQPWDLRWHAVQHRWSTAEWDWAVSLFHDQLTSAGLETLRRQLTAGPRVS